jgi:hypothetical protein
MAFAPSDAPRPDSHAEVPPEQTRPSAPARVRFDLTAPTGLSSFVSRLARITLDETSPAHVRRPASVTSGASPHAVWHRVTLAPGVELHYQPSGDRRREETIAHLIRAATSLLAEPSRDGE